MRKLNNMTDEELALAYVGGDNRAFDLLLSRNEVKLFSYILFVVHDEDLANDIFQETFVKAISRLHAGQYSCSGKFISWLMRIAHNVIIDGYRSQCVFRMVEQGNDNDLSCLRGEDFQADCAEQEMVRKQVLRDVKKLVDFSAGSTTRGGLYALLSADVFQGYSRVYQCEHPYESRKNALCAP